MSLNTVVLMGRLVASPELKTTQSGVSVLSFTLAVDKNYQQQGEERKADFVDCVAWRNTAEFISKYFGKGSMIGVEGSLQTRTFDDKDGNKRKATEVLVARASFCGAKNESRQEAPENTNNADYFDGEEIPTDDLPF